MTRTEQVQNRFTHVVAECRQMQIKIQMTIQFLSSIRLIFW